MTKMPSIARSGSHSVIARSAGDEAIRRASPPRKVGIPTGQSAANGEKGKTKKMNKKHSSTSARFIARAAAIPQAAAIIAVALALFSCSTWFEEKIALDTSREQTTLYDMLTPPAEITELLPPSEVHVSQAKHAQNIYISWSATAGASSYRIERAAVQKNTNGTFPETIEDESEFEPLTSVYGSNSYTDTIIGSLSSDAYQKEEYQTRYFYRVQAENIRKGLESDYKTSGAAYLLPPVCSVEATKGKSKESIVVTWDKVLGAESYDIYRTENGNGLRLEQIGSVQYGATTYTDPVRTAEQGIEFYYAVYAKTGATLSAASPLAMGYSLKAGAPNAPENVHVENGIGTDHKTITVCWDKAEDPGEGETITYSLYKTSSADSSYRLVKSEIAHGTTKYDDSSCKPGIYYYYFVQTVKLKTNTTSGETETLKSAFSENEAVGCLLSAPSSVEAADGDTADTIKIRWTPAVGSERLTDGAAFTYTIYAKDSRSGVPRQIAGAVQIPGIAEADGYLSHSVKKENFYCITTSNTAAAGKVSAESEIFAPMPDAPQNVTASKTEKMPPEYGPNAKNVYPVQITWQPPAKDTPAGYHVYRSQKPDSAFRRLTDTPITGTAYIDQNESAKAGTLYYYKVVSLNELDQGKKGNDPANGSGARGYGALTADEWFREYNKTTMASQKKLTLMHKTPDTAKLGSETINGDISGNLSYKAAIAGLGAEITMHYEDYADFYIMNDASLGVYFRMTGNTDTTSNMSANGTMHGTVVCTGMYPGEAKYDSLQIKGGAAGGGVYIVTTKTLDGNVILENQNVDWKVGEENR
ncbi:MAG: hypothetical protein NC041_04320 [Bacteroides sp.]|nr:hypothetical protein [Prevotella sp.]MCM1407931.1 hypothetical protein [Treponema brennaborense]MCM1469673.1 hypothetical protein [Bacteroides sp.]